MSDWIGTGTIGSVHIEVVESRKGAVAVGVGIAVAGGFRQVPVPQSTP